MNRFLVFSGFLAGCGSLQTSILKDGEIEPDAPVDSGTSTDDTPDDSDDTPDDSDDTPDDSGDPSGNDSGNTEPPPDGSEAQGIMTFSEGRVIDPKLDGAWIPFNAAVNNVDDCEVWIGARNGIGQVWTHSDSFEDLGWNGRDDDDQFFDTGPFTFHIDADCGDGVQTLFETEGYVIRLGISSIDFHDGEDASGNVDIAFHKRNLFETEYSPISDRPEYKRQAAGALMADLDSDDGTPRPIVTPWADPDVPPWIDGDVAAHNVPAAYVASEPVSITVTMGESAVSQARRIRIQALGPTPDIAPDIHLLLDGDRVSDTPIGPGSSLTLSLDAASDTMGKDVRTLNWSFEAKSGEEWHPVAGSIQTQHVLFTLAGEPALLDGSDDGKSPALPWVGVLDDTATIMEGVPATTDDVLDALRDYLFNHEYIVYDPGAGDYTDFEGPYIYWSEITAQISAFLDRRTGLHLYCHSMSCTLSALAGNHGVFAEQLVLGVSFYTNQTRAAGTDGWMRWSFNSHSVVSPDDGATIWDSSIAMDGDDEPDDYPIEEIMPRGMDGEEYMWRLTYDDIDIVNQGLCYIE